MSTSGLKSKLPENVLLNFPRWFVFINQTNKIKYAENLKFYFSLF
jgi:hypothetical protein